MDWSARGSLPSPLTRREPIDPAPVASRAVTGQTSNGYLLLGPVARSDPTSSTLNFPVGDDRANGVTVALSIAGTLGVTFVAPAPGPSAHVIFDVTGYFTPLSGAPRPPLAFVMAAA